MDAWGAGCVLGRALLVLTSVSTLVAAGIGWSLQQRLDTATVTSAAIPDAAPTPEGEAFTALLVGVDARTDASGEPLAPALLDALHAGPDEGQLNTDTIILLHVPAGPDAPVVAVSIPRDSFVPIAGGRGVHKINSAYRRGLSDAEEALAAQGIAGADLDRRGREAGRGTLVTTVEDLTGVEIDHLAEINLAGFVELTDALGGIPVCLNSAVRDPYSGVDLAAGPQAVSGAGALAFVRQRHGLEDGDLDRIRRQQAFMSGLVQRLLGAGTLADPARLQRLVDVVTRYIVLDRGWDLDQAVRQLRRLSGDDLSFRTIPTGRPDLRTPRDGVAVEIDVAAVRGFVGALIAEADAATSTPSEPGAATAVPAGSSVAPVPAGSSVAPVPAGSSVAPVAAGPAVDDGRASAAAPRTTKTPPPPTRTATAPLTPAQPTTPGPTPTDPSVITTDGIACVD